MRKMALMVESTYNALNLVFAWFSLANFYVFFVGATALRSTSYLLIPSGDPYERPRR